MATNFGQNWQNDLHSTRWRSETDSNIAIPIYSLNGNIFATICASLIKIGPVTPEITRVISAPFGTRRQKSVYLTEYLSKYWTDRRQTFSVGRHVYDDYQIDISFAVAQGTLLW